MIFHFSGDFSANKKSGQPVGRPANRPARQPAAAAVCLSNRQAACLSDCLTADDLSLKQTDNLSVRQTGSLCVRQTDNLCICLSDRQAVCLSDRRIVCLSDTQAVCVSDTQSDFCISNFGASDCTLSSSCWLSDPAHQTTQPTCTQSHIAIGTQCVHPTRRVGHMAVAPPERALIDPCFSSVSSHGTNCRC